MTLPQGLHFTLLALFLASFSLLSNADQSYIEPVTNQIHPLRPQSGSAGSPVPGLNCQSWQLAVETHNLRPWNLVPEECENYVGNYLLGAQYKDDCLMVTSIAYEYAKNLTLSKNGKDIWVFDIDDTCLSTIPYHARPDVGFGTKPFNKTAYREWQAQGDAPAVPAVLEFYKKLQGLGVKFVFLSASSATLREVKIQNLRKLGFDSWETVISKGSNEKKMTSLEYKSSHRVKLEKMGYRIIGNMGDQWSDLLGPSPGLRTFKLPDPMYYVA